jgi:hypothetical protein
LSRSTVGIGPELQRAVAQTHSGQWPRSVVGGGPETQWAEAQNYIGEGRRKVA